MAGILTTLRDALEPRLETISGLEVLDHAPDGIMVTPVAIIHPPGTRQRQTFSGAHLYRFEIELRLVGAVPGDVWAALDSYMAPTGSSSIEAAIDGDKTLGGNAAYAVVLWEEMEAERDANQNGGWSYRATIPVEVSAP
mgnify:FL=1